MTMNPYWSASDPKSVLEYRYGPEPWHPCSASRIDGLALTLFGTYRYICRLVGLVPKFVIWVSEAAAAGGAAGRPSPIAAPTARSRLSRRNFRYQVRSMGSLPPRAVLDRPGSRRGGGIPRCRCVRLSFSEVLLPVVGLPQNVSAHIP